jgi:hypothetical protein
MVGQRTEKLLRGPGYVLFRSPLITVPDTNYTVVDVPVPEGFDEATILISAKAGGDATVTYYLYQRPGQVGLNFANFNDTADLDCIVVPNGSVSEYKAQAVVTQHLATDQLRVQLYGAYDAPSPSYFYYQVNVMFTKRTPDRPV